MSGAGVAAALTFTASHVDLCVKLLAADRQVSLEISQAAHLGRRIEMRVPAGVQEVDAAV